MPNEALDAVINLTTEVGALWDSLRGELADLDQAVYEQHTKADKYDMRMGDEWRMISEVRTQMMTLRSGFDVQCRNLRQVTLSVEYREAVDAAEGAAREGSCQE